MGKILCGKAASGRQRSPTVVVVEPLSEGQLVKKQTRNAVVSQSLRPRGSTLGLLWSQLASPTASARRARAVWHIHCSNQQFGLRIGIPKVGVVAIAI